MPRFHFAPHQTGRTDFPYPAFRAASSAPLSPLYLWLPVPTCLPRRPRRSLRTLTVVQCAGSGLHPCTRDWASPVFSHVEAHWLWFIFIQAHRFLARTACSTPRLAGGQAPGRSVVNRPTRPVGLSPTSATTFTGCGGAPSLRLRFAPARTPQRGVPIRRAPLVRFVGQTRGNCVNCDTGRP